MKFSEYLRKLDEGNLGHELEKQEAAKKKPNLKVGENSQEVADRTMSPEEQKRMASERKDWRAKLRPTGDDGKNTVKEPSGETMLDPKTGKPFPKSGPLKDWQVPSLRESERPGEAINYGRDEEEEPSEPAPVITNPAHPDYKANDPHNVRRRNNAKELADRKEKEEKSKNLGEMKFPSIRPNESVKDKKIRDRMNAREEREERLKDSIEHSEAKRKANESVEAPARDALGRLSIQSMQEASMPKPLRKALKKANMGKKLSNKESGRVMRNTKADMSTRTNAAENYKNPQDDIDAHDAAEGEYRSGGEGTPRQKHLDK